MMHPGHFNAIRQAKSLCDVLVVGISSDAEILAKKGLKTLVGEADRYAMLKHIKWIDEIIVDVPYSPDPELLEKHKLDFVIHGDDIPLDAEGNSVYQEIQETSRLGLVKRTDGISTSDLIARLMGHERTARTFICSAQIIAAFCSGLRPKPEDRVIYLEGVFDLFQVQHAEMLAQAKALGTYLIVGLFNDRESLNLLDRPVYMSHYERLLSVAACRHVDDVVLTLPPVLEDSFLQCLKVDQVVVPEGLLNPRYEGLPASLLSPTRLRVPDTVPDMEARVRDHWEGYHERVVSKSGEDSQYYETRSSAIYMV
jgi:ethanolamine-phosphate cytidylyltransferase